jgi:hypothetical protein
MPTKKKTALRELPKIPKELLEQLAEKGTGKGDGFIFSI